MTTPAESPNAPRALSRALGTRRFLLTSWPWRGLAYSGGTVLVACVLFFAASPVLAPWAALFMVWTGDVGAFDDYGGIVLVLALCLTSTFLFGPLVAIPLGALERWRLGLVGGGPRESGHREPVPGLWGWVRTRYTEAATWREVAYAGLMLPLAGVTATITGFLMVFAIVLASGPLLLDDSPGSVIDLGPVRLTSGAEAAPYTLLAPPLLVVLLYASAAMACLHSLLARTLLVGPPKGVLHAELNQVTESRARLVNAFEYERRRIERDLHDGAQQRLVALSMDLGVARLDLEEGSEADQRVVAAQAKADELITELRELVRGVHPRVLTDRGLPAALEELADRCPVPVTVHTRIGGRLPAHVEGTAYFVVAEALTNVCKHTAADAAAVHASAAPGGPGRPDTLLVEVTDHGAGGADPARGSGLTGLGDRVAVMGGTMELSSPEGGPTRIRVELPCGPVPPTPLT
ncbi:sensor domain-containing protein [Nocardiopsis akebiae]|uniref:histidine kinase n=1 Tax=Nocardiopsis akebiae TaxID=2831968 RepID=A0ABX8CDA6_9ACTN|nr:sensor histidine kinase [Nocardiopsis akebiae]QUX31387.1 sensor domain-containing protein [Nocardiopsis akebiae]